MTARRSLIILVVIAAPVVAYFATRGGGDDDASSTKPVDKKDRVAVEDRKPGPLDVVAQKAVGPSVAKSDGTEQLVAGKPVVPTSLKPVDDAAPVEFSFPEDSGGQLLSRKLTPPALLPPDRTVGPKPRAVPRFLENPGLPASKEVASLPRLDAEPKRRPALPHFVTPEQTPDGYALPGALPQSPQFPIGDRLKVPSVNIELPVDLPLLAQPLPDKAAASDPTTAAARESVLSATMPGRTARAPFMIFSTPDPFENHDTVRLREGLGEEIVPAGTGSQSPRR